MSSRIDVACAEEKRGAWMCTFSGHLRTFLSIGWVLVLGSLSLTACGPSKERGRSQSCTPNCEAGCGVDDGCGSLCPCSACPKGRPCFFEECGLCAANETCLGGKCVCEPSCGPGWACLADGCGGTCPCADGLVQDAKGRWVEASQCADNCAVAGWTCGVLCGQDCGSCSGGSCELGHCESALCDGTRCDHGCACEEGKMCAASGECVETAACGDTCTSANASCGSICGVPCGRSSCEGALSCIAGQCRPAANCATCALKLSLIDKTVFKGRLLEAVVALDYQPAEGEPRPRLSDLRIAVRGDAELTSVEAGPGLLDAGKELQQDARTNESFKRRSDGTYQLMALGVDSTSTFVPGRLATLRFAHRGAGPLAFSLVRRAQVFAPPIADAALQTSAYDEQVVVTP